ncbi:unnamed protein product [Brassica rapa subsp. trilocularis]
MEKQLHKTMEAAHVERAIRKIKLKGHHGGGGKEEGGQEEEEDGGDEEEEDSGDEEEEDSGDEEGGGKFSAFISVIAEAFEE